jgi:hypothetical protein
MTQTVTRMGGCSGIKTATRVVEIPDGWLVTHMMSSSIAMSNGAGVCCHGHSYQVSDPDHTVDPRFFGMEEKKP